ncbi:hypothetical protein GGR26_003243 [Lewinella marina]|uniref:Uncharacterized protein n=1 Tax=Neolewinella marina TaxID=438751 RepID=A0A2G0CE29_9BACT|nr:hypothetical protein [Neolewinella marina]NJB87463.1 hypothetical protein [Neolewinella marina]PHK98229.1 hypothetical protein CGL56_11025 [Neolewinella marina]
MIREPKITTLAELRKRKKQVRMEAELAKREFAHSIGTTRDNAGTFLVKNVVLPAGGGLLGLMAISKLFSSNNRGPQVIKETKVIHEYPDGTPYVAGKHRSKRSRAKQFTALMGSLRMLMPIIQAIIGAVNTHKAQEAAKTAKRAAVRK